MDARRRTESYLEEAQRLSQTGSFAWRAASQELQWSSETYRILGIDRGRAPSWQLAFERLHPDDRERVEEKLLLTMSAEPSPHDDVALDIEARFVMDDHAVKHVQMLGRVRRDPSGATELLGAAMDVTARKRAIEELQQAQAALFHVARVTTLGELAASIAHEVNQPIAAMVSDAAACMNWLAREEPPLDMLREALDAIVRDGERAGEILARIRRLLSRSSAGHETCELDVVISQVLPLARPELSRHGVKLEVALETMNGKVSGDSVELQQLVLNLVLNACEASRDVPRPRRRIVIRSCVNPPANGPWAIVSVEDSGVGLPGGDDSRLFDPFYSTKPGGLGMGLSISRSIIERHAGRIWATRNPEYGATFHFALPLVQR